MQLFSDIIVCRSKQNLFFRQASQPPTSIPEHHALERSLTITYKFPSERPKPVKRVSQPQEQPVSKMMPSGDSLESAESVNSHQMKSVEGEGVIQNFSTEEVKTESEEISQEGVKNENEEGGGKEVKMETVEEHVLSRTRSIDEQLRDVPAFKFITRPDLYKFAKVIHSRPQLYDLYLVLS